MKGSVGEPHSDQRDRPRGRPDGFVRGHRLWIAVKPRGSTTLDLRRDESRRAHRVVGHLMLPDRIQHVRQLPGECRDGDLGPRRSATCFAHRTIGSSGAECTATTRLGPTPIALAGRRLVSVASACAKPRRVFTRNEAQIRRDTRGVRKSPDSSSAATNRAAVTGPTPGTVMRRVIRSSARQARARYRPWRSARSPSPRHQHALQMRGQPFRIIEQGPRTRFGRLSGVARGPDHRARTYRRTRSMNCVRVWISASRDTQSP